MRVLILSPLFAIVIFGAQGIFLDELVYARHNADHCCMCGTCSSKCWCGGQANCRNCHTSDGGTILSQISADNLTIDIRQTARLKAGRLRASDFTDKIMTRVRVNSLSGNFSLRLIDNLDDYVKTNCVGFES